MRTCFVHLLFNRYIASRQSVNSGVDDACTKVVVDRPGEAWVVTLNIVREDDNRMRIMIMTEW